MKRDRLFYEKLLPFCKNEKQKLRILSCIHANGSIEKASNDLGIHKSRLQESIGVVSANAFEDNIKPANEKDGSGKIVGIIGDSHIPYEHKDYRLWVHDVFDKNNVDYVIHIGDLIDHHALSFHDSEPSLKGAYGEYIDAMDHLEPWKTTFPQMTLIRGNHDLIPSRQISKLGINPDKWMRPLSHVYEFPQGWVEVEEIEIDGVIYHHGHTSIGVNGFRNDAKNRMQNSVSGHVHGNLGISYTASQHRLVWGMAVGCGIDNKLMAFAYGKHFKNKPIVGCGVVAHGEPHVFAMDLGEQ